MVESNHGDEFLNIDNPYSGPESGDGGQKDEKEPDSWQKFLEVFKKKRPKNKDGEALIDESEEYRGFLDPENPFPENREKKKRGSFWTMMATGVVGTASIILSLWANRDKVEQRPLVKTPVPGGELQPQQTSTPQAETGGQEFDWVAFWDNLWGRLTFWTDKDNVDNDNIPSGPDFNDSQLLKLAVAYTNEGTESSLLQIEGINDLAHAYNPSVIQLAAEAGGPTWLFDTVDVQGNPVFSERAFNDIVTQLNLDTKQQSWLRTHLDSFRSDPDLTMKLLNGALFPGHQADPAVIKFYQCTMDVYNKDPDKTTWQDRIPGVQACSTQVTSALPTEVKHGFPRVAKVKWTNEVRVQRESNFNELVAKVEAETGGIVGQMLGPLETLINMPIDTTAMHEAVAVDMAELYQHESQKPLLANTGLPLVLTGLVLLRIGPAWPREVIAKASKRLEDIYYWFKLGQSERVMRDLMVLGKQAWERVAGKKD